MRSKPVERDSQPSKLLRNLPSVSLRNPQDQVGLEGHNLLQAWIQDGPHVGFELSLGRVIAVFCVAYQAITEAQRIHNLRDTRGKRNESMRSVRNSDAPAGFISDLAPQKRAHRHAKQEGEGKQHATLRRHSIFGFEKISHARRAVETPS